MIDFKLHAHLFDSPLKQEMRISRGGLKHRYHIIFEVSSNGFSGFGEAIAPPKNVLALLKGGDLSFLFSLDLFDIPNAIDNKLNSLVYFEGLCSYRAILLAIHAACLDCIARLKSIPLASEISMSAEYRPLNYYASNIYWKESVSEMNDDIQFLIDNGCKSIKAHIGVLDPFDELRRLDLMPAISKCDRFMLDFNCGYSTDDALKFTGSYLNSNHTYFWLEELVKPDNLSGIQALSEIVPNKLAFGENHYGEQFDFLSELGIKYLMPDLGRSLTSSQILKLHQNAVNSVISLHNYSSGILLNHTLSTSYSLSAEVLVELDLSNNALIHEFYDKSYTLDDSKVHSFDIYSQGASIDVIPESWNHATYEVNERAFI